MALIRTTHRLLFFAIMFVAQGGYLLVQTQTTACPSTDWEENGDSCFLFKPSGRLSWDNAKVKCWDEGGYLTTILNETENTFIANRMHSVQEDGPTPWRSVQYHIGYRMNSDRDYEWLDGNSANFSNWNPYESFTGFRQPCVYVTYPSLRWRQIRCNGYYSYRKGYVCRSHIGLTNASVEFSGHEYFFNRGRGQNSIDWFSAGTRCNVLGGHLASILNEEERNFITDQFISLYGYQGDVWIGLNELGVNRNFSWSDGTEVNYRDWGGGQPTIPPVYKRRCAYAKLGDQGHWYNGRCADGKGYVCKREIGHDQPILPTTTTVGGFCPTGFFGLPGWNKCYKIVPLTLTNGVTWREAYRRCAQEEGIKPELASITDPLHNAVVSSHFRDAPNGCWIGMYRESRKLYWLDNTPSNWTNFAPGGYSYYNCGEMLRHPLGSWTRQYCSRKKGYICQTYKDPSNLVTTAPSVATRVCKEGWTPYWNGCYKVIQPSARSWDDADDTCVYSEGGHLVSIVDEAENAFVQVLTRNLKGYYWIGYSQNLTSDRWEWVDGWHTFTTHWGPDQPLDVDTRQCAASNQLGEWVSRNCTDELPIVCKINNVPVVGPPPEVEGFCPDGIYLGAAFSWIPHGANCYYFIRRNTRSWDDALRTCMDLGAVLASLTSEADNHFIIETFKQRYNSKYWIGLYRNKKDESWMWNDHTPIDFLKWAPGEPGEDKNCAALETSSDRSWKKHWIGTECSNPLQFICQKPKVTLATKPAVINGYCPDGDWEDYGSKCFSFQPDDLKSWPDASSECSSIGGQLAMISDRHEHNFVFQMQKKTTSIVTLKPYWLGVSKVDRDSPFRWVDGRDAAWTYWAPNQPNEELKREFCVAVDAKRGFWNGTDCYSLRGYVCETNKTIGLTTTAVPTIESGDIPKEAGLGLTPGTIAGMVVGCLIGTVLIVLLLVYLIHYRKKGNKLPSAGLPSLGFFNPGFGSPSEPSIHFKSSGDEVNM